MNSLLSEQILPLTIPEKLKLIEDIWDSIVINADQIPLTQSQKQELDRRLASYQNIENQGESWEVVKQRIIKNDI
jgi:putative addiction module component (TIGR02574 family)